MISETDLLERFEAVKRQSDHDWLVRCPAHADGRPSLHVTRGEDRWLLKCLAGCEFEDVREAARLSPADLSPPNGNGRREIAGKYPYTGEHGEMLFEVVRFAPKDFRQRRPDGAGGWIWKLGDTRRVIYRLPEVIAAVAADRTVYVAEGEEDVHALERSGEVATTNPGGAGKWRREYTAALRGAKVVIVADADEPGRAHAEKVAKALDGVAATVEIVEAAEGKDARDHLDAGRGVEEFVRVLHGAPKPKPVAAPTAAVVPAGPPRPTAELLEDVLAVLDRYVVLPGEAERIAVALWTLHSWAFEAAHATPYLLVVSPERRAGKTRLLEILELLIARPWRVAGGSEAAMFRKISAHRPTLLLDEIDAIFGSYSERTEPLRAVLNAGNRPGSSIPRCVGEGSKQEVVDFNVYSAKVLAGIDSGRLPDTIVDRAIGISMKRRTAAEPIERFRYRHAQQETVLLREQLEAWAAANEAELREAEPDVPADLNDRAGEAWESLLAIADHAGIEWGTRAREAAIELSAGEEDEASRGTRLLADIRTAFNGSMAVSTEELLEHLNGQDESAWGAWHEGKGMKPRDVARLLKPYGAKPKTVRLADGRTAKGYHREQLEDAWARYCPPPATEGSQASHPSQPSNGGPPDVTDVTDNAPDVTDGVTHKAAENARKQGVVTDVTDVTDSAGAGEVRRHADGTPYAPAPDWMPTS